MIEIKKEVTVTISGEDFRTFSDVCHLAQAQLTFLKERGVMLDSPERIRALEFLADIHRLS